MFDDAFFNPAFSKRKKVSLASKQYEINVKEFPIYKGSESFSGLVGSFQLNSRVDKPTLKVGESLTYNVELKGSGNLFDATIDLKESKNFKSYDDKPVFRKTLGGQKFSGVKIFKKALVPKSAGRTQIEPIRLLTCLLYTSPSPRD